MYSVRFQGRKLFFSSNNRSSRKSDDIGIGISVCVCGNNSNNMHGFPFFVLWSMFLVFELFVAFMCNVVGGKHADRIILYSFSQEMKIHHRFCTVSLVFASSPATMNRNNPKRMAFNVKNELNVILLARTLRQLSELIQFQYINLFFWWLTHRR